MEQIKTLVDTIVEGIQEKKGAGVTVLDLSGIEGSICRYMIICQGNSPAQVEAIAESVSDVVRTRTSEKPVRVAGLEHAIWVAMDYTDVMVHIFLPDAREYYDLDHLWNDAPVEHIADVW